MKIHSTSLFAQVSLFVCNIILACLIAIAWQYHIDIYMGHWLAVALLVVCLCLKSPAQPQTLQRKRSAILNIIAFQLSLYFIFFGISQLFNQHTFVNAIQFNTNHTGLFPWAYMILVAVALKLTAQRTQQDTSIPDILATTYKIKHGGQLWSLLHLFLRQTTHMTVAFTLALISLGIYVSCIGKLDYFSLRTLLISLFIIFLIFLKATNKYLLLVVKQKKRLSLSIPIYTVALGCILVILGLILTPLGKLNTHPPGLIQAYNTIFNSSNSVLLFGQSWWLCWTIIGGCFIAHHSRTLNIRQMIITSLCLPIITGLLIQCPIIRTYLHTPPWTIVFAIAGLFLLLNRLLKKDMLPCYILNYLPISTTPKQRAHQILITKSLKAMLVIIFFTLPIGYRVLTTVGMIISAPLVEVFIFVMLAIILWAATQRSE